MHILFGLRMVGNAWTLSFKRQIRANWGFSWDYYYFYFYQVDKMIVKEEIEMVDQN